MTILHGILAELGIEDPDMHPEREAPHQQKWVVDEKFTPVEGKSYELAFGKILFDDELKHVVKRVRIAGSAPSDWIDLDTGKPLDQVLHACEVKAFRPIAAEA